MSGYDAAKYYTSIKLHFNEEKYNAITYNFKTKSYFIPENKFYIFQKLYKLYKDDLVNFYVANFLENPKSSLFDLVSPEADYIYRKWKIKNESLTYLFKQEISELLSEHSLKELLQVQKNYPILMIKVMQEEVSMETLLIMDSIVQYFDYWNKKIKEDIVWKDFRMKCNKYRCFMNIDVDKFKQILKKEVRKNSGVF